MTIFKGTRRRTTKMNITFSGGKGVPNTVFKFFPQKNIPSEFNQENWFGAHFPYIYGSIGPIVSKSDRDHQWVDPHQPCDFHENRFKTATCITLLKAGTDYGTYSAAQPDAAAKNMMFAGMYSQQTCCKHAMNMFRGRAVLPQNEPKIVGFQNEHKGIPCHRMPQAFFLKLSNIMFVAAVAAVP